MKRWSLLVMTLTAALLAGLAHLRADWLATSAERPAPSAPSAVWAAAKEQPRVWASFLRQK